MIEFLENRQEKSGVGIPLSYGKFLFSHLKKGQGMTLANTLRRTLLYEFSSLGITSLSVHYYSENRKITVEQSNDENLEKIEATEAKNFGIPRRTSYRTSLGEAKTHSTNSTVSFAEPSFSGTSDGEYSLSKPTDVVGEAKFDEIENLYSTSRNQVAASSLENFVSGQSPTETVNSAGTLNTVQFVRQVSEGPLENFVRQVARGPLVNKVQQEYSTTSTVGEPRVERSSTTGNITSTRTPQSEEGEANPAKRGITSSNSPSYAYSTEPKNEVYNLQSPFSSQVFQVEKEYAFHEFGFFHEFSAIPGVKENLLEILLNLQSLVFTGDLKQDETLYLFLPVYSDESKHNQDEVDNHDDVVQMFDKSTIGEPRVVGEAIPRSAGFAANYSTSSNTVSVGPVDEVDSVANISTSLNSSGGESIHFAKNSLISKKQTLLPSERTFTGADLLLPVGVQLLSSAQYLFTVNYGIKAFNRQNPTLPKHFRFSPLPNIETTNERGYVSKAYNTKQGQAESTSSNSDSTPLKALKTSRLYTGLAFKIILSSVQHSDIQTNVVSSGMALKRKKNRLVLPIDGSEFPIKRVNYTIEKDPSTSGELVFLEIWTNGSIHPKEAVRKAVEKSISLFQQFI